MSRWLSREKVFEKAKTEHLFKDVNLANRELTFTLDDNTQTAAVPLPKDYYTNITFDQNLKRMRFFKPDDANNQPSNFVDLPIVDAPEKSPFRDLKWVDTYNNPMIRASINAQVPTVSSGGISTSSTTSNVVLNDGLAVNSGNTFTTNEFQFANTDGLGILEFYFGDVNTSANDQIIKVETLDYKNLKHTTAWGDMLFKMNGSNRFCGVFNSGSNSPIKISDNSYPSGSTRFLHNTTSNAENPSGYGSGVGTGPSNIPLGQMQNATAQVAAASGALIAWNNSNANANPPPSKGFLNTHYLAKGDTVLAYFVTDSALASAGTGGISYFGGWKVGPEILNGGSVSIASGDHVMIMINENTVKYYKNGVLQSSETQTGANGARIGGVTDFRRKLTVGHAQNSGSFTLKKFAWHKNKRTSADIALIYAERDFSETGGASGTSNIDLSLYHHNAIYNDNNGGIPKISLVSANITKVLNLRNSHTKAEITALGYQTSSDVQAAISNISAMQLDALDMDGTTAMIDWSDYSGVYIMPETKSSPYSRDVLTMKNVWINQGLYIDGTILTYDYPDSFADFLTNGGGVQANPPNLAFGLVMHNSIICDTIVVKSDERIKDNIRDINDETALKQLRLIQPKIYQYKDKYLKEVIPQAITTTRRAIPNILKPARVYRKDDTLEIKWTLPLEHNMTPGVFLKVIIETDNYEFEVISSSDTLIVVSIGTERIAKIEDGMSAVVYGEIVDDFHCLDEAQIFTIATASVQELDRQLQAEKAKTTQLQAQMADVLLRLNVLEV
mmetsp:Transcript_7249/g.18878  ORF Transcript_7249/g.18878 Transcript_7249/m.18878 type:complete len:786 (-) Transcript_7249:361-2718(-)